MSFERTFRFFTYATALWAFATLALFAPLHMSGVLLFLISFFLCLFRHRLNLRINNAGWLAISIVALTLSLFGWFVVREHFYSVVYLFLYLEINKLWTGTRNRDVLQVYALTFFQMLAASVSTANVFFAFALAIYLFLILGSLITITFKKEAELAFAVGKLKKKEIHAAPAPVRLRLLERRRLQGLLDHAFLTPRLLIRLTAALVFILITGTCLFFITPRLQGKAYVMGMAPSMTSKVTSGFSDSVNFFGMGEIQQDPTMVMRIFPGEGFPITNGRPDMALLKLRGTGLDYFDGRSWAKSQEVHRKMSEHERQRSLELKLDPAYKYSDRRFRVRVLMEPNSKGYLFGPQRPAQFFFGQSVGLISDEISGSLQVTGYHWSIPLEYHVESRYPIMEGKLNPDIELMTQNEDRQILPDSNSRDWRRQVADEIYRRRVARGIDPADQLEVEEHYLQLPDTPDVERVAKAAQVWTEDLGTPQEIARFFEHRLKHNYSYSLDVSFSKRSDHLSHFLLERQSGHCEYFATSMVIMLRARGIPARIVNGYATDEWVSTGEGFFVVRQEHAHSWVEAWFPRIGWVSYDPTPEAGLGSSRLPMTFMRRISRIYDNVKFAWYDKVIDYGVKDQGSMFRLLMRAISAIPSTEQLFSGSLFTELRSEKNSRKVMSLGLLLVFGLGALGFMAAVGMRRRGERKTVGTQEKGKQRSNKVREYLELLDEVERHVTRAPSLTPLEYARKVAAEKEPLGDFVELTERYYGARFHDNLWTKAESERVIALLRRLREQAQTPP